MKPSDLEALIAYLDDELDAGERQAMTAKIESDAEFDQALTRLQANDALLLSALQQAEEEVGDENITGRVGSLMAEAAPVRAPRTRQWSHWMTLAASIAALAIGIGLGAVISDLRFEARLTRLEIGRLSDSHAIEQVVTQALEKHLSGQSVRWQSQETGTRVVVTPVRTYRSQSGKWCREFTQQVEGRGDREALRGIACRDADGLWRPQLWRPVAASS